MRYLASQRGGSAVPDRERIAAALVAGLFPEQRALVCSTARQRLARCGRRAGKTTAVATALVLAALEPGAQAAYVALTRENAKYLLVPELERLAERHRIPMRINVADLVAHVGGSDGGTIFMRGTDNEKSVDKLRSFHFELLALDEMAFYGAHVAKLVDSLEATMLDRQGAMVAISSPGYVCAGKFWDIDQPGTGWERHHWSVLQNPHIPHAATWLADLRRKRAWADDDPTYQREYLGVWTDDARSLCLPFDPRINLYDALPVQAPAPWHHVMGIDVGYAPDPCAFVVLAYNMQWPTAYVVHSERQERWLPRQVWDRAAVLERRYGVSKIHVDATAGQVAELQQRFSVPVTLPPKAHKAMHIEHIADDLRHGHLQLRASDAGLIQEMRTVAWDAERKAPEKSVPNDLSDALQYAWQASSHYAARPPPPRRSQEEEIDEQEKRYEREAAESASAGADDFDAIDYGADDFEP